MTDAEGNAVIEHRDISDLTRPRCSLTGGTFQGYVDPGDTFTSQLSATTWGMAMFPMNYSQEFLDNSRIYIQGNGEGIDFSNLPAGVELGLDVADRGPQQLEDGSGKLGVTANEIVVDRHDVDLLVLEESQISRQVADDGLALAGLHLGHVAFVEHLAAECLAVEVTVLAGTVGRFAQNGKRLGQDVGRGFTRRQPLLELVSLGPQGLG